MSRMLELKVGVVVGSLDEFGSDFNKA